MDEIPPSYDESLGIAVCPAAPFDNEGYEEDEGFIKPPTAPPVEALVQERMPVVDLGSLSADDIREACLEYVSENCCYGSKFVRKTELPEILTMCTYHYQLETFGEKRESVQRTEPFRGQPIDGPENGQPPEPWSVVVPIAALFQDGQLKMEIPHTASVRECGRCIGNCRVRCESCYGRGGSSCFSCGGMGRSRGESCTSCSGTGRRRCWTCNGTGQVKCGTCDGKGRLKHFRLLIVTWINHIESYITDTSKLPKTLIIEASGKEIFKEQNIKVRPINHALDETVNLASNQMVTKHETAFPQELIRQQRHTLRAVPLTKAKYSWKRKQGELYVYGFQKKVYFEDYPQKCCCCTCC